MQASAEHARRGCAQPLQGYMQVCHDKRAPLLRVPPGDRMAYYAPALAMGGKEKLQSFVPYRSNVAYVPAAESPIVQLLDRLELTADRARWGDRLRFGLIWICYIFDSYSGRFYLGPRPKTLQISSGPLKKLPVRCADRQFQIVQLACGRRLTTATSSAERIEVSDLQH